MSISIDSKTQQITISDSKGIRVYKITKDKLVLLYSESREEIFFRNGRSCMLISK